MSTIKTDSGGFTAIELIVMLVVLAVTFTAFASGFNTIQTLNKKAKDVNISNQLAFAKIQEYENKPFSSIATTTPTGTLVNVEDFSSTLPTTLRSPRSAIVYINTVSSTLKQVVVNVTYGSGSDQKTIQYADFVQKNGL